MNGFRQEGHSCGCDSISAHKACVATRHEAMADLPFHKYVSDTCATASYMIFIL